MAITPFSRPLHQKLIQQRERETLEFKREMPGSSDLARLVTAFYNTQGGIIVLGVEDDTRDLVGVPNPQGIAEKKNGPPGRMD